MSKAILHNIEIAGVSTCVPARQVDNLDAAATHGELEVRKVVGMAGVRYRRTADESLCSSDLCFQAARDLMQRLDWAPESITALIMVTQTPDYLLPSTACLVHKWLGLASHCAAFDVGLGCSGYPYGLYLAGCILAGGGHDRILLLHGETPSRFTTPADRATALLFGDAGSATALRSSRDAARSHFNLQTDGTGYDQLIIRGGGFRDRFPSDYRDYSVKMDGAGIFKFTIERVPPLVAETLTFAQLAVQDIDQYIFHQSNQFIMRHVATKCGLPAERVPIILERFGNTGGASIPLCLTQSLPAKRDAPVRAMFVGYGVGLSWGAAVMTLAADSVLTHREYSGDLGRC